MNLLERRVGPTNLERRDISNATSYVKAIIIMRRFALSALVLCTLLSGFTSQAQAFDPAFGYMFGYSLGQANQFRNRLPAPPYFAVYPPVYYGQRYARPYGESPYASWPLLTAGADYQPRPHQTPVTYSNPHASGAAPCADCTAPTETTHLSNGGFVTIENPYASSKVAAK